MKRIGCTCAALLVSVSAVVGARQSAAQAQTFSQAVRQVMDRQEFRHVSFGIEIYSIDQKKVLFSYAGDKFFTPGSTTKLLTEGTAMHYLGANYRFHTPVYRTGPVKDGTLDGSLVLVASGDPNLSNRMQPDGTLAFADEDHSYGGPDSKLIPGDPALVLRDFAKQIKAAGIRKVKGQVQVDVSLFPEGDRELGTGVVISPICVNDNVIDVTATAGASRGAAANLAYSLTVPYIHFVNKVTTADAGSKLKPIEGTAKVEADGSETVTLEGVLPTDKSPYIYGYPVDSPSRFAKTLLTMALKDEGVEVDDKALTTAGAQSQYYTPEYRVAEHVSAPLSEDVKLTLKMSQNLHASMTPFLVGAIAGKATTEIDAKAFNMERQFFADGGLDVSGVSQADGAGGALSAYFTPDFMVHYLEYMAKQPDFALFEKALPVLGRDGTLVKIQKDSPAAGQVFAKTGTFGAEDLVNGALMVVGKGLAGYTTSKTGEHLSFALYMNHLELPPDKGEAVVVAGQALGEIAAAAHDLEIDKSSLDEQ
jgi:PBP4 family serine-type D-alanyl-D-alanine carboxypeptidase